MQKAVTIVYNPSIETTAVQCIASVVGFPLVITQAILENVLEIVIGTTVNTLLKELVETNVCRKHIHANGSRGFNTNILNRQAGDLKVHLGRIVNLDIWSFIVKIKVVLDVKSSQAKSYSQTLNLSHAQPVMKPLGRNNFFAGLKN